MKDLCTLVGNLWIRMKILIPLYISTLNYLISTMHCDQELLIPCALHETNKQMTINKTNQRIKLFIYLL